METFGSTSGSLLLLLATAAGAAGFGSILLRKLAGDDAPPLSHLVFSTGLGLGVFSFALFLLGAVRLLRAEAVLFLLFLFLLALFRERRRLPGLGGLRGRRLLRSPLPLASSVVLAAALLAALVGASAPPIESDALTYHLPVAKAYAERQGIVNLADTIRYSVFPELAELLFAFGFLTTGVYFAQYLNVLYGLLLAAAAAAIVLHLARDDRVALLAAAVVFTFPSVGAFSTQPLVDLPLALYLVLELFAVLRWVDSGRTGWMVVAALSAGFAFGTKYTGGVSIFLPFLAAPLARSGRRRSALALFGLIVLGLASPWLVRNALFTGDPISPFGRGIFRARNFDPFTAAELDRHLRDVVRHTLAERLLFFRDLVFRHTPLLLAVLPLGFFARAGRSPAAVLLFAWGALLTLLFGFLLPEEPRFFLAPVVLLTAWALSVLPGLLDRLRVRRGIILALVLVPCILPNAAIVCRQFRKLPVALGIESEGAYLRRRLEVYPAAERARALIGPEARILSLQENRVYYFPCEIIVAPSSVLGSFAYTEPDVGVLLAEMKKRGFTHLLVNGNPYWSSRRRPTPLHDPAVLATHFDLVCEERSVRLYSLRS
jgi:hypothetical protein